MATSTIQERVLEALTTLQPINANQHGYVLVFLILCGIMGFLTVVLDAIVHKLSGTGFLKLAHSFLRTPMFLLAWPIGAMIVGYFAQILGILQATVLGALTAGVTWNLILKTIVYKLQARQETDSDAGGVA